MAGTQTRLSREDWIACGLTALLDEGPGGVAVQPIARQLGATKGSFYWHFESRDDLLAAVLARWEVVATDDVIAALEADAQAPADKAAALFQRVAASSERHPGQLSLLSDDHPEVRVVVARVTARRIAYVARLLRAAGLTTAQARRRAILAYAAYLGHAQLFRSSPEVLPASPAGRRQLMNELARLLIGTP